MYSAIRLTIFLVVGSVLLWIPQAVYSQEENPDLQRGGIADLPLMYAYIRDDSNIATYDYDRQIFSVGVAWNY